MGHCTAASPDVAVTGLMPKQPFKPLQLGQAGGTGRLRRAMRRSAHSLTVVCPVPDHLELLCLP